MSVYLEKILQGNVPAAARLIRRIEDQDPVALEELTHLYPHTGRAHIVGLTGAPGVGKSSLIDSLISVFRSSNLKVGVVAVDPTSPFTGGAILGDRVRMQRHYEDPDVFIRSLATRGWLGGLSQAVLSTIHVMDAMGKDIVLVETVGAGQSEVDIARVADTVVVILSPVSGDEMQMIKAGIMEIGDIFVINKADKEGASAIAGAVEFMLAMKTCSAGEWKPRLFLTEAIFNKGTKELADCILERQRVLSESGSLEKRRRERARLELVEAVENSVKNAVFQKLCQGKDLERLVSDIADRRVSPYAAAVEMIARLGIETLNK